MLSFAPFIIGESTGDFNSCVYAQTHKRRKGAQNPEYILAPDAEKVLPYADIVRAITLAPEMPGGYECIRALKRQTDIAVSMGHSMGPRRSVVCFCFDSCGKCKDDYTIFFPICKVPTGRTL